MVLKNLDDSRLFNKDDVYAVAAALINRHYDSDVSSSGGRNSYNECRHCEGRVRWNEPADTIKHDPNCAVLIAKDLLTRSGVRPS